MIFVSKFYLSGLWSPGILVQPTGAAIERKLDERSGYGIDLPFLIYTGRKLARFRCEISLVTKQDRKEFEESFGPLLHTTPRRGPVMQSKGGGWQNGRSHVIWHPQLAPLEINQCIVSVEPQIEFDGHYVGRVPIDFVQVKQLPEAAYVKPEAPPKARAQTATEKAVQDRTKELNDLDAAAGKVNP